MAIITVKDAQVTRLNNTGHGLSILESNTADGKTYKRYYKVWFKEPHGLNVGDVVSVSGFPDAAVGEPYEDRTGTMRTPVNWAINSPRVLESTQGAAPVPAPEPWATTEGDEPF